MQVSKLISLNSFLSADAEKDTWNNAQLKCHELDSELVVIDDLPERDCIDHSECNTVCQMINIRDQNLRPHLLVHPNVMEDFSGVVTSDPNCVVIGDCAEHFTFSKLNDAFEVTRGGGLRLIVTSSMSGSSEARQTNSVHSW